MHKFRASSLGDIMTEPKGSEKLSVGAKTVCEKLAKQQVYGYSESLSSKYLDKGLQVEDASIALVNSVFFTDYVKNTERRSNDWITGEADIVTPHKIIDVKSSWSLKTFHALASDGFDKGYEWQGRAYMWLWEVEHFELHYCLVDTPEELLGFEDESLHRVAHINPALRVTCVPYTRDRALEEKIKIRVQAARDYMDEVIQTIANDHQH